MLYTRREMGTLALAALPAASLLGHPAAAGAAAQAARKTRNFHGVSVGIIGPYAFRGMQGLTLDDLFTHNQALGVNATELQETPLENAAGAPRIPPTGVPFGTALNAEQQKIQDDARAKLREWRLAAGASVMDTYRAIGKKWASAGMPIQILRHVPLGDKWPDGEIDYAFNMAKALGAKAIAAEPPLSSVKRLARFADKHQLMVGFHNHTAMQDPEAFARTGSWEQTFFYSKFCGAQIDIGHYTAAVGNELSVVDLIRTYHDRIIALHLKDRRRNGGPNVPWGQGDTPIKEVLQLMKREKYAFQATIELEYPVPEGSNGLTELDKCLTFIENALA